MASHDVAGTANNLDLRDWLATMADHGELLTITEPVDHVEEMSALTYLMGRTPRNPVLQFMNVEGAGSAALGISQLWNPIGSSWPRMALTLGLPKATRPMDVISHVRSVFGKRIPTAHVEPGSAPVLQNTLSGAALDLSQWPFPRHWPHDGGQYCGTADLVITRDIDDGRVNVGTYRMMLHGPREVGLMMGKGTGGNAHREKAWARGKPLPVAAVWGAHPAFLFVSSQNLPSDVPEYDYLGGLIGGPVVTTNAPLTGLPIPAYAEVVIEGELLPGAMRAEGPFGEFHGYYGSPKAPAPLLTVHAIHFRNRPILTHALMGDHPSNEEAILSCTMRSARIWQEIESLGVQGVKGVYCPPSACAGEGINIISVEQRHPGHAKQVLTLAGSVPAGTYVTKWVIAVDDDVDPSNIDEVLWAMATRCPPSSRITVLDGLWNTHLDTAIHPVEARDVGSRAFIDATKDFRHRDRYTRTFIRQETYEKVAGMWPSLGAPDPIPDVRIFDSGIPPVG